MSLSAVVVCGGRSTRMGRDKAFLTLCGKTFLLRVVLELRKLTEEIFVTVGSKNPEPYIREVSGLASVIGYAFEFGSPMSGLAATIDQISGAYFALVGCDMPLVRAEVVRYLYTKCLGRAAAVPRWPQSGVVEPLCAVYSTKSVRSVLGELIAQEKFRLVDLIERLSDVEYVSPFELIEIDPQLESLSNVNTPEEYEALVRRFEGSCGQRLERDARRS